MLEINIGRHAAVTIKSINIGKKKIGIYKINSNPMVFSMGIREMSFLIIYIISLIQNKIAINID